MQPIGPLMHEHRLIERMVALLKDEMAAIEAGTPPDVSFLEQAVDFYRTYADRCHHGKEEDILFAALKEKPLEPELARMVDELIEEHVQGRQMVRGLSGLVAKASQNGGSRDEIVSLLRLLTEFYPRHIEKEDKHFFHPVMDCFSRAEMDAMLEKFEEFDRRLVHEKYAALVDSCEARKGRGAPE